MFPLPPFIRFTIGAVSGLILLSAIAGVVAALVANARPAWGLFGFEVVIAVAGVFGVLMAGGGGRYREGPGLAAACIAGTVFVGSVLGYFSLQPPALAGWGLKPFLAMRLLGAGTVAAAGAWCVLSRHPASWRLLLIGLVLGLPVVGAAAVAVVPQLRAMLAPLAGAGAVVQMGVVVGGFLVLGSLLCASAEFIIRAFEQGAQPPARRGDA